MENNKAIRTLWTTSGTLALGLGFTIWAQIRWDSAEYPIGGVWKTILSTATCDEAVTALGLPLGVLLLIGWLITGHWYISTKGGNAWHKRIPSPIGLNLDTEDSMFAHVFKGLLLFSFVILSVILVYNLVYLFFFQQNIYIEVYDPLDTNNVLTTDMWHTVPNVPLSLPSPYDLSCPPYTPPMSGLDFLPFIQPVVYSVLVAIYALLTVWLLWRVFEPIFWSTEEHLAYNSTEQQQ